MSSNGFVLPGSDDQPFRKSLIPDADQGEPRKEATLRLLRDDHEEEPIAVAIVVENSGFGAAAAAPGGVGGGAGGVRNIAHVRPPYVRCTCTCESTKQRTVLSRHPNYSD